MMKETLEAMELSGNRIQWIYRHTDQLAVLHQTVTSPRGNFFHRRLLQFLEKPRTYKEMETFQKESKLSELTRHVHYLVDLGLIEKDKNNQYVRTLKGEKVVNVIRRFESMAGENEAKTIFEASCGPNSLRLFLKVYGTSKDIDWSQREISFTPTEIGKICTFLPRTSDGVAAIDKLSDANILTFHNEGSPRIILNCRLARCFCQYLMSLHEVIDTSSSSSGLNNER